jgi:hypothetical protein
LATSQPAIGREISRPAGSPNNTAPRAALFKRSLAWISGMREAQLEKVSPAKKKKLLTAIRYILFCDNAIEKSFANWGD